MGGGLQMEVLSVQCTTKDANYLKYLLAEAGSRKILPYGIFVPMGIHLMEGKEVLSQLLQEQQTFLTQVTSFQIGRITCEEMFQGDEEGSTIKNLLLKAEGVSAVEKLYHTSYTSERPNIRVFIFLPDIIR